MIKPNPPGNGDGGNTGGDNNGGNTGGDNNQTPLPESVNITPDVAATGLNYSYQLTAPKELTGTVRYQAKSLPDWAKLDAATGIISGTPLDVDASYGKTLIIQATGSNGSIALTGDLQIRYGVSFLNRDDYIDYYALDWGGKKRVLRNDLEGGNLAGEVQFIQSHTAAPHGNWQPDTVDQTKSIYRPNVQSNREALLVFIPTEGLDPVTVDV